MFAGASVTKTNTDETSVNFRAAADLDGASTAQFLQLA